MEEPQSPCIDSRISPIQDINDFELGQYLFVTKFQDANPNDPWYVGLVDEIGRDLRGPYVRFYDAGIRKWRNALAICKDEGRVIIDRYGDGRDPV